MHKENNKVVEANEISEGTAIGEVWQILPNAQEKDENLIGDRITEVIATDDLPENEIPQIIYVSYQDSDVVEQPRMLHFGKIYLKILLINKNLRIEHHNRKFDLNS